MQGGLLPGVGPFGAPNTFRTARSLNPPRDATRIGYLDLLPALDGVVTNLQEYFFPGEFSFIIIAFSKNVNFNEIIFHFVQR